jgi:hypothetical protein
MPGKIVYFCIRKDRVFRKNVLDQAIFDHYCICAWTRTRATEYPSSSDKFPPGVTRFHVLSIVPQPLKLPSIVLMLGGLREVRKPLLFLCLLLPRYGFNHCRGLPEALQYHACPPETLTDFLKPRMVKC